ncbi:short-chain dehydrogenase/reductase SDR, partial [Aaosphaeria arxii CBS 175.79]
SITGSSSGIGRATAIECARHGARLVLHHIGDEQSRQDIKTLQHIISSDRSEVQTSGQRAVEIALDIRDVDAGQRLVDKAICSFGKLDSIVHNAGICQFSDFMAVTQEQQERHMAINYTAAFRITQSVVEHMISQGKGGSVVNIASVTATAGSSQLVHYAASKAALLGMTVSSAVALGKYGIRVNAVSPGTIETAMNRDDLSGAKKSVMEQRVPLGRLGKPDDVARAVVFFVSSLSEYVSGQNLIVDGAATISYQ